MMEPILGLVVALRAEARAVLGRKHWKRVHGRVIQRSCLPDGTSLICVCSGVGIEKALSSARWLVREGAAALAILGGYPGDFTRSLKPVIWSSQRPSWRKRKEP